MKPIRICWSAFALAFTLLSPLGALAQEGHKKESEKAVKATGGNKGELAKVTEKEAAWAAKQREAYPMTVCLTSDEKLGSMGENAEFVYREKGKPDRLIIFCCSGCEEDFLKDPAKYLAKLDAAAKAKSGNKRS